MAYCFVHDSDMWLCYGVTPEPFWKLMDNLGITDNSKFWGYWQRDNPVTKVSPSDEKVMVSSYKTKGGLLVVAFNDTDKAATVKLKIDAKLLGNNLKCYNAENKKQVNLDAITLPAQS